MVQDMLGLVFVYKCYPKVIDYEIECNYLGLGFEQDRRVFCWYIASSLQILHIFVVCKSTSLGKAIYTFSNLAKYHDVVYDVVQFLLMHNILWYYYDRYEHVLIPFHLCI